MAQELKIALIQTSILWENPSGNRRELAGKIDSISQEVDLIVLPEMFTTGFTMTPKNLSATEGEETLAWMTKMAHSKNAAITGSLPYFENQSYTNRLFFITPDGQRKQYDKKHTFTLAKEDKIYESGKAKLIVDYKGFRICPLICYDLRFPVWARYNGDYDVLLYVANWPKPRIAAWDALLKARAIENIAYCAGVNRIGKDDNDLEYPGHSAVYDPLGSEIAFSKNEEIIHATLIKEQIETARTKLMFLEDRDGFEFT